MKGFLFGFCTAMALALMFTSVSYFTGGLTVFLALALLAGVLFIVMERGV